MYGSNNDQMRAKRAIAPPTITCAVYGVQHTAHLKLAPYQKASALAKSESEREASVTFKSRLSGLKAHTRPSPSRERRVVAASTHMTSTTSTE